MARPCRPVPTVLLPAYSPQLNLLERLWRYLKGKLACHRWWDVLARLQQAAETLLTGLEVPFHATDGPAFRPLHIFRETALTVEELVSIPGRY